VVLFTSNLLLAVSIETSLQLLWGLINSLQLIVYIGLFSTSTPANAQTLFELISEIMNLDLFNVAKYF